MSQTWRIYLPVVNSFLYMLSITLQIMLKKCCSIVGGTVSFVSSSNLFFHSSGHICNHFNEYEKWKSLSPVQFFVTPWTVACQAPLSMGFSRQEYWRGMPLLFPEYLPDPRIEPASTASWALAGGFFTTERLGKSLPAVSLKSVSTFQGSICQKEASKPQGAR